MPIFRYIIWHYFVAPIWIFELMSNYEKGTWHQFMIGRHLATLFSPWHRSQPSDLGKRRTFADVILDFVADFYIRIIAAFMRLIIITAGLVWMCFLVLFFLAVFAIWIFWPIIFVLAFLKGIEIVTA